MNLRHSFCPNIGTFVHSPPKVIRSWYILLFLVFNSSQLFSQQSKLALLVGESRYDSATGWVRLHAFKDIEIVKKALLYHGFADSNILVIQDHDATKGKIIAAFNKHLLGRSAAGDIAFFYYSGHGQRVQDKNGDETDGYDESFVPVDAPQKYQRGVYEGQNHLTDDEFNNLLQPLRNKLGTKGTVLVVVDACFSGNITRSFLSAVARGSSVLMAGPDYKPASQVKNNYSASDFSQAEQADRSPESQMITLTACRDYETAFELSDSSGGVFTSAFTKCLLNTTEMISYDQLYKNICIAMADDPRQNPTIEGSANLSVFGNTQILSSPSPNIFKKLSLADTVISLCIKITNPRLSASITSALENCSFINISKETADLYLFDSLVNGKSCYWLTNTMGLCLDQDCIDSTSAGKSENRSWNTLTYSILQYLQARNLNKTILYCRELQSELQLIPISEINKDPYLFNAKTEFAVGDTFTFRLKIKGPAGRFAFYSLVNISNGSKTSLLRPTADKGPDEFRCPLNEFVTLKNERFVFSDAGKETFLLICSDEPIDLKYQFTEPSNITAKRGEVSFSFNQLNAALKTTQKRALSSPKISVFNLPVVVRSSNYFFK